MSSPGQSQRATQSRVFTAIGDAILRGRWLCLGAILALTGWFAYQGATNLVVNNNLETFTPQSEEMEALRRYRAAFGRDDLFLILIEGDVFTPEFLTRLKKAHDIVAAVDADVPITSHLSAEKQTATQVDLADEFDDFDDFGEEAAGGQPPDDWAGEEGGSVIEDVMSLVNARQILPISGGIELTKLLDPMPAPEDLPSVRQRALSDPAIVGRLVGEGGQHAVIAARTFQMRDEDMEDVYLAMQQALAPLQADDFVIRITGPPAINAAMNQMVLDDLGTLAGLSVVIMVFVMIWLFRHPVGVLGPIVVVAMSVVWTIGFMAQAGIGLNIVSSILPSFLLCVGIGDSVHLLSIYRDHRRLGLACREALVKAIGITGPPVLFTSLTTMCGLFSLHFASVPAIAELGIAGGVGVIFAFLLSITLLPVILTFAPKSMLGAKTPEEQSRDWLDRSLGWLVGLSDNRRATGRLVRTLVIAVVFAVVAGVGISRLEVWHDDLATMPDDAPAKVAVQELDKHVGGVSAAVLVVDPASEKGIKDLELLKGLEAVSRDVLEMRDAQGRPLVGHALSVIDVVKETRRAFNRGDPSAYRLPDTQGELDDLMFLFENQGPDEMRRLATLNLDLSHLTFQVEWREATSYAPLIEQIDASVDEHVGDKADVSGTGMVYLASRIVSSLMDDLTRSFSTAFLFITLLMVVMLRDLKLGLIAMVPNLFPIAIVMGAMGLTGIPLDLNTLLIASIALGIAVDDTIHYLHHFKVGLADHGACEAAIDAARRHAGRAMFGTSLILAAGFFVYSFAVNKAIARFGVLIGLTVVAALLVDLVILPALLRLFYRRPRRV